MAGHIPVEVLWEWRCPLWLERLEGANALGASSSCFMCGHTGTRMPLAWGCTPGAADTSYDAGAKPRCGEHPTNKLKSN